MIWSTAWPIFWSTYSLICCHVTLLPAEVGHSSSMRAPRTNPTPGTFPRAVLKMILEALLRSSMGSEVATAAVLIVESGGATGRFVHATGTGGGTCVDGWNSSSKVPSRGDGAEDLRGVGVERGDLVGRHEPLVAVRGRLADPCLEEGPGAEDVPLVERVAHVGEIELDLGLGLTGEVPPPDDLLELADLLPERQHLVGDVRLALGRRGRGRRWRRSPRCRCSGRRGSRRPDCRGDRRRRTVVGVTVVGGRRRRGGRGGCGRGARPSSSARSWTAQPFSMALRMQGTMAAAARMEGTSTSVIARRGEARRSDGRNC